MKREAGFRADDGTLFSTAAECRAHEQKRLFLLLESLSQAEIAGAFERTNVLLANAIERAGNIIAAKRRASGDLKRKTPDQKAEASVNATMDEIKENMKAIS